MSDRMFINRELSWLNFNQRVLMQAEDDTVPLLEKLKFLAIFSSNLDEFFMIRVAGIKDQIKAGFTKKDISGLTPDKQLEAISKRTRELVNSQYEIYSHLKEECQKKKIFIDKINENNETIDSIFSEEILPSITPVTLSPANPSPFLSNLRLCIFVTLRRENTTYHSLIILPEGIKRAYKLKEGESSYYYTAEKIILNNLSRIYKGYSIENSFVLRVTRNADLTIENEEVEDLFEEIEKYLGKRKKGGVVRVEIDRQIPESTTDFIKKMLSIEDDDIYVANDLLDLTFLFSVKEDKKSLYYKELVRTKPLSLSNDRSLFVILKEKDVMMFRPFHDFSTISNWVEEAANDERVISIKMTLYRANRDSRIIAALAKAAKKGKHVCVVIELKARFDEEKNLEWAKRLEEAGCIVTYGFVDLKIHAKCLLIVRKEDSGIKRYCHLSTGNYNENTASVYTDIDYLTSDGVIGQEMVNLFNFLMGYSDIYEWKRIIPAPRNLRKEIISLIDREIDHVKNGKQGKIIAKINSLYDEEITLKLYEASKVGVDIHLIIRGICSLKAGITNVSENIKVKSIVGRFLEHPRIIYFLNGGEERFFISTADWMGRNLDRRVEVLVEIIRNEEKVFLKKILEMNLSDDVKSWELQKDDSYIKTVKKKNINYQEDIYKIKQGMDVLN